MRKIPNLSHIQNVTKINWSIPRWYINGDNNIVVLSTGEHDDFGKFTGTCLPCEAYPNGDYSDIWSKTSFRPLDFDFAFMVSNSDDESTPESENDE